jgi:hypothetical protein
MPTMRSVLKFAERWWPVLVIALLVTLRSTHAFAAVDIDLDQGFSEAESKVKRYVGRGLQLFGMVVCVIGIATGAYKLSRKDGEGFMYLVGTIACAGLLIVSGAIIQ